MAAREHLFTKISKDRQMLVQLFKNPDDSLFIWAEVGVSGFEVPTGSLAELIDLLVDIEIKATTTMLEKGDHNE